ncbi:MAG: hypothetical protein IPJ66_13485 [Bacteroidetes bacterium]|nr:hypothetical protein [Bacteroidota bacterium]
MKKLLYLLHSYSFFSHLYLCLQTPQSLNYQAVARNTSGAILATISRHSYFYVRMEARGQRFSRKHIPLRQPVWFVYLVHGNGTVVSGIFSSIP